jgi:phosphatidylinositol alpha-mannosyltransferase
VSAAARHFIDRFFPGDYKVIPNGVDVARFRDAVPIARWQDGTSNILFVGRHEPRKGLLDLLKAHRILRKTGCNCRLLIVGTGPQEREARRYVLTSRMSGVEFLGRVSDEEKAQLFRTADVYVSPATGGESFGIVLLEAMAAGAPVLASDLPAFRQVLDGGRLGELFEPGNVAELAAGALRLLGRPDERDRLRSAGLIAVPRYDWSVLLPELLSVYELVAR